MFLVALFVFQASKAAQNPACEYIWLGKSKLKMDALTMLHVSGGDEDWKEFSANVGKLISAAMNLSLIDGIMEGKNEEFSVSSTSLVGRELKVGYWLGIESPYKVVFEGDDEGIEVLLVTDEEFWVG